ncbi:TNF receptor-associated factor 5 [Pelomyxa schiedti]|nr:TNF receptor-associated factor 5 [Pelomyxa schiedti]
MQGSQAGAWFKYAAGTLAQWDTRWTCPVCGGPAFRPAVHECGSWLCDACSQDRKNCPTCGARIRGRLNPVTDKPILDKLAAIEVHCPACHEKFLRDLILSHIVDCPIECPNKCGVKVSPNHQAEHERSCVNVLDVCADCKQSIPRRLFDDGSHQKLDCPIYCANGCEKRVKPRDMAEHQATTCTMALVKCPAERICTWTGPRQQLSIHVQSCVMVKMAPAFESLVAENKRMQAALNALEEKNAELEHKNTVQTALLQEMQGSNNKVIELCRLYKELEANHVKDVDYLTSELERMKTELPLKRIKFTTLNGALNTGPTIVDYTSPLQRGVTLSRGIQRWVVPLSGTFKITAVGASGGSGGSGGSDAGLGAVVTSVVELTRGQVLNILVGQPGVSAEPGCGGGGGGTFVWEDEVVVKFAPLATNGKILICAGGGGGSGTSGWFQPAVAGQTAREASGPGAAVGQGG